MSLVLLILDSFDHLFPFPCRPVRLEIFSCHNTGSSELANLIANEGSHCRDRYETAFVYCQDYILSGFALFTRAVFCNVIISFVPSGIFIFQDCIFNKLKIKVTEVMNMNGYADGAFPS